MHKNGIADIRIATDAAKASGEILSNSRLISKITFAIGVIGLGMLSVLILSASAPYTFAFCGNASLELRFKKAAGFV